MTLEALANAISIGTLIAFSLVCAGVMVLRYSGGSRNYIPVSLIIAFICTTFTSAMFFTHSGSLDSSRAYSLVSLSGVFGIVSIIIFIVLCFMNKNYNLPKSFKCPLVPFVPCMGIAINSYMLAGLKLAAWIRLFIWLAIGILIYAFYGIWNSKMRRYRVPDNIQDEKKC